VIDRVTLIEENPNRLGGFVRKVDEAQAHAGVPLLTAEKRVVADPAHLRLDREPSVVSGQRESQTDAVTQAAEEMCRDEQTAPADVPREPGVEVVLALQIYLDFQIGSLRRSPVIALHSTFSRHAWI
jgi:hypothetical protein